MRVTERGFAAMTLARSPSSPSETCGGKLVLLLEGGYDLGALARSVRASLEVLTGRREDFPLGAGHRPGAGGGGGARRAPGRRAASSPRRDR